MLKQQFLREVCLKMTRPVNLYVLSRITNETTYNRVEKHFSGKNEKKRTQLHEILSLRKLVDSLLDYKITIDTLDGFFIGYSIPQIGKEFDLLKITSNNCLNIELKSQFVPEEEILDQLKKNRHYLSHLGKKTEFYTVVTDSLTTYMLTDENTLQTIPFSTIVAAICKYKNNYLIQIDNMFRASDYLVSPLNTPERFINGEYFLTQAQEQIKKDVLSNITDFNCNGFYSIIGKPGTGKTLLIYDIAKELSKTDKTLLIHCGKLSNGQQVLNCNIQNFHVIAAGSIKRYPNRIKNSKYILIDEAHRFHLDQFDELCRMVETNKQVCVFSSDPEQILSRVESRNDIVTKILQLPLLGKYKLSEKIRTNKELASFIIRVRDLSKKPHTPMDYSNVTLAYAANVDEAKTIIEYYKTLGYVFINYSKSNYQYSPYSQYEEDYDTHHVIGQEFDNILMLMDKSFYYDKEGKLRGKSHPNPDYLYPNLFYQGITRVREKIALVVVDAPELFEKISTIII